MFCLCRGFTLFRLLENLASLVGNLVQFGVGEQIMQFVPCVNSLYCNLHGAYIFWNCDPSFTPYREDSSDPAIGNT